MMTWFDAVLVTLLALVTALGARRGLAGAAWGVGAVIVCLVSNMLSGLPALVAALGLSVALSVGTQRLAHQAAFVGESPIWHSLLGALGGLGFGVVLACALTLGFPVQIQGNAQSYPSATMLSGGLYNAVKDSYIQKSLQKVWVEGQVVQTLLVPDQTHKMP